MTTSHFPALFVSLTLTLTGCSGGPAPAAGPPTDPSPLAVTQGVRAVYQVSGDRWKQGLGRGLFYLRKLAKVYPSLGVAPDERSLVAVLHGAAGYWALDDRAYAAWEGSRQERSAANPNKALIQELLAVGVRVELCASTMAQAGWTEDDLLAGVEVVPAAYPRVIDLQLQGYAHIVFD